MNAHTPTGASSPVAIKNQHGELKAVLEDLLLDEIYEALGLARSYIDSMMQATVRDDRHELHIRRRQISNTIRHAFQAHTLLGERK